MAFDNPEGAIFRSDGQFVFISNSAELGMHWTHKGGYISKPTRRFAEYDQRKTHHRSHWATGMAVIPVATKKFPAGTIFVIAAWAPLAEADTVCLWQL